MLGFFIPQYTTLNNVPYDKRVWEGVVSQPAEHITIDIVRMARVIRLHINSAPKPPSLSPFPHRASYTMSRSLRCLHDLPAVLETYTLPCAGRTRLDESKSPDDCLSTSTCLAKRCPFCRNPISPSSRVIPAWLTWLVTTFWFIYFDHATFEFARTRAAWSERYLQYLEKLLFDRALTPRDAWDVFYAHAQAGFYNHALFAKYVSYTQFGFWCLGRYWGPHYPELHIIGPLGVDPSSTAWCLVWLVIAHVCLCLLSRGHFHKVQDDGYSPWFIALEVRFFTVLLGFWPLLWAAGISWVVYCGAGGIVIGYCLNW